MDISPEGAKVHVPVRPRANQVRVNGVVILPGRGGHARSAMVSPRPGLQRGRRSVAYRRILRPERRDAVVQVVQVSYLDHLWGLDDEEVG